MSSDAKPSPDDRERTLSRRRFVRDTSLAALGLSLIKAGVAAPAQTASRLSSFYVSMRDGTRMAVDLWLPADLGQRKIGTILQPTRYTRSFRRAGQPIAEDGNFELAEPINRAGMAYIVADGRGTGASFGWRGGELTAKEFDDFAQLIEWIARQPFSNGRVGAMGVSYPGTLTESLAKVAGPALRAIAPLFDYFDVYRDLSMPGGLYSRTFMNRWRELVGAADRVPAIVCEAAKKHSQTCEAYAAQLPLPAAVDAPNGTQLLQAAMQEHARNVSFAGLVDEKKLLFRDDARDEFSWRLMAPDGDHGAIERSGVAYFVQASWLDAGSAHGALRRLNALSNAQQVEIGAWSHGGGELIDTFASEAQERSLSARTDAAIAFFSKHLGSDPPAVSKTKRLRYYVMGSGQWLEASSWPPPSQAMRCYLDVDAALRTSEPQAAATVPIAIKADHGTGPNGRWGARPVHIRFDRNTQTRGLTTFRTEPLPNAATLAGNVRCRLRMSSNQRDGSVFVYLDAVLPNAELRYLTEGSLRLIHRATGDDQLPTFTRAQARAVVPDEAFEVNVQLLPIAARIERGWRLQLSFADRDVDWFDRYDDGRAPSMALAVGSAAGSYVELPFLKE